MSILEVGSRPIRLVLRVLVTVVIANALFLALTIVARPDRALVEQRVREAFVAGDLAQHDYRPWDARRGWHQYNDCNVLQMLGNSNDSRIAAAVAPVIYKADEDFIVACPVLYSLVMEDADTDTLLPFRYGRYWHGYNAVAGLALRAMPLHDLRRLQKLLIWFSAGVLAFVSWRCGRRARLAGSSIALTALIFWAAPYFAPGLTHGPGDALLLLAVAGVAAWPRIAVSVSSIAPFAAGFGAVTAFFSMLTGQLPTGAGWLMALTLAVARDRRQHATDAGWIAITALIAFGFGAAATVATKQVLAFTLAEPETWRHFLGQLDRYSAIPAGAWGVPGVLVPFAQLARRIDVLTSGSEVVGYALIACVSLIWSAAAVRGWDRRQNACGRDMLILVGAAIIPVAWVMLLPQHSYIHATFMVRMFVVPIAIAPLALLWPFMARDSGTDAVEA